MFLWVPIQVTVVSNFEPIEWKAFLLLNFSLTAGCTSITEVIQKVVDDPDNVSR